MIALGTANSHTPVRCAKTVPAMIKQMLHQETNSLQEFFNRSTQVLEESDSNFRPTPEQMSVAGQVAHTAQTIDWFMEGAFRPDGFDMDFETAVKNTEAITSLAKAREWFATAVDNARKTIDAHSEEEWGMPIASGPIMGDMPRLTIMGALTDHTAHHRGALTVYSRLLGKVPPMPYM